jgi:CHAT domain
MPTYLYDDFRIDFAVRPDGSHDVVAHAPDGRTHSSTFDVHLSTLDLQAAIVNMARSRSRAAGPGSVLNASREVESATPDSEIGDAGAVDAEAIGTALAEALFADEVGDAYDQARESSAHSERGLRLTLGLIKAPALMSLPWEFLYRRPRFIASQRHTPLVRCLDQGSLAAPPAITKTVRILGVISSPVNLTPLDVDAERRHVESAVAKMVQAGRVELDWLEPATPSRLRKLLRDNDYHIIHYVGHSSFTDANEGAIFLEDETSQAVAVDNTMLANMLSDQPNLRLVVLNSCEGARTTISDPYAGVATTLIQLGVPAVVAMQFEITDRAAILFADELYTNLIGRQDPIDAAVAEARKAIYVEIDRVEWATPVLFVRDPDVQLFDFKLPTVALPPPPPPDLNGEKRVVDVADPTTIKPVEPVAEVVASSKTATTNALLAAPLRRPTTRSFTRSVVAAGIGVALIAVGLWAMSRDDPKPTGQLPASDATTGTTVEQAPTPEAPVVTTPETESTSTGSVEDGPAPRPHTGLLSVEILESDRETHLYRVDLATNEVGDLTDKPEATDTQGSWGRSTNRVAFTRQLASDGTGTGISYVVADSFIGDRGRTVAPLIRRVADQSDHFPAWAADGSLFYLRHPNCDQSLDCDETLRRATFTESVDSDGFRDALEQDGDEEIDTFIDVRAVAADPLDPERIAVVDVDGLWLVNEVETEQLDEGAVADSLAFTRDGEFVVGLEDDPRGQSLTVASSDGELLERWVIEPDTATPLRYVSLTATDTDRGLLLLSLPLDGGSDVSLTTIEIKDDGSFTVIEVASNQAISDLGTAQAIAL